MNKFTKGNCRTQGAGTAEIVYILPSGKLVVVHHDGEEFFHKPDGKVISGIARRDLLSPRDSLTDDIAAALNRACAESESGTPDFILAAYLNDCLAAFNKAQAAKFGHEREAEPLDHVHEVPDYYDGEWHDWHGGEECPVPDAKMIFYRLRNGEGGETEPKVFDWGHTDSMADIVAFRVIQGPPS